MMSEKILACPFPHCGSERCEIYKDSQLWYVFCDGCGSEGPFANTEAEAIALWNAASNALSKKDEEIAELNDEIKRLNVAWRTSEFGCTNLRNERDELKAALADTEQERHETVSKLSLALIRETAGNKRQDELEAEIEKLRKRLKDCQDMYQLNLECHYDTKERLTAERDEARRVARRYYNAANAWMKNWTELINALPARNEPQSIRVGTTDKATP